MNIKTKSNIILACFLFFTAIVSYNFFTTEKTSQNMARSFSPLWVNNMATLIDNIKQNENKLLNNFTIKNLTKLDLIPRDFATHIINYKLEESYLEADAGILIYTKNNNDSMSLVLKDVPKSACYYYSNGLKDNKYLSKIIINKTPLNLRLPEKAACHNSMNVIELLL